MLKTLAPLPPVFLSLCLSGCFWVAVGGGAAETGYVAGQKDRSTSEVVSDQWIFTKIKAAFMEEEGIKSRRIDVSVHKGVVTLEGLVMSDKERRAAVAVAAHVKGVKHVINKIDLP